MMAYADYAYPTSNFGSAQEGTGVIGRGLDSMDANMKLTRTHLPST